MGRKKKLIEPIEAELSDVANCLVKDEDKLPVTKQVSHSGELPIGDIELKCFVSEDGQRYISGRSMTSAIGMKGRGQGMARISTNKTLNPFISNGLSLAMEEPTILVGATPKPVHGYKAEALADLCDAILDARNAGALKTDQEHRYALFAETLVRGFARVGIVALIDEATGYQDHRAKDALSKILEQYLDNELQKWTKTFPDAFYKEIFRLRGWDYKPWTVKRPSVIGKWTNDFVYDRLAPGILEELKGKTPVDAKGNKLAHYHRWFNPDFGHPRLREHIFAIITLMKVASSWDAFKRSVDKAFPKEKEQLFLDIDYD